MANTEDQKKVIESRNKNLIVSAAAGSGKTHVLSTRIADKICEKDGPDINKILIVTFTNAAAREMRDRIGKKLREKLKEDPDNPKIRKQIAILHTAQITTIDSFCLYILKNHFEEIELDPAFAVGTEGEIKQISEDAFNKAVEEAFKEENEDFLNLVEIYAPKGIFKDFYELVKGIADKVDSMPYPYEILESFVVEDDIDVWSSDAIKGLTDYEDKFLDEALKLFTEMRDITENTSLKKHYDKACDEISFINTLKGQDFKTRIEYYKTHKSITLGYGSKKFPGEEEIKAEADSKNAEAVEIYKDIEKNIHYATVEEIETYYKEGRVITNALAKFVIAYLRTFETMKRDRGLVDYSDMEHMALRILVNENKQPTQTAESYRNYFEEVMIDEYQDSNEVQETILSVISKKDPAIGNRFMVGDVKQSIYRFRHAEPSIFIEMCKKYADAGCPQSERINLKKNFRSRQEVIDAVNYIFERCMKEDIGGVLYDDEAKLYFGQTDYQESKENNKTELLYFSKEDFEGINDYKDLSKDEIEARIVATKIRELIDNKFQVLDQEKGGTKDIEFSDIAIMMRGMSGGEDVIYQKALKEAGIPAYVISKSGYYSAWEVQLILNYLSVIDNPRQDLPLLHLLNSFIGDFTQDEIAKIRTCGRTKRLIDSMYLYLLEGKEESLKEKIQKITEDIDEFRRQSLYMSASDIIRKIYEKYEYTVMVSSLPGGEQRLANVNLLAETADEYEDQGIFCIHDFIKYTEKLKNRQDMGEANMLDEKANVVKIMTVHKSKGLEFPVCFLCAMHTQFKPPKGKILVDKEYGLGGDTFNLTKRTKGVSPVKKAIYVKENKDNIGEEIRVLYVALTRAREKLFMTGMLNKEPKIKNDLSFVDIIKANSFMNLVYPIIFEEKELFIVKKIFPEDIKINEILDETDREIKKNKLNAIAATEGISEYKYPHESLDNLFVKTTVSELKKAAYLENEDGENSLYHEEEVRVPKIIAETDTENGGAARGSAYHRVMELMDFEHIYEGDIVANLRAHRQKMKDNLFIFEEDDALVNEDKILKFLDTDLSKRMSVAAKNDKLYLEQPFVLAVPANEVNEEFPENEKVLVQGVIDVYFEEDGKLILMDYKTDRVDTADELVKRYKTQLDYYSEALSRLEKKPVAEIMIYSFSLGECIRI